MNLPTITLVFCTFIVHNNAAKCPNGNPIYIWGISEQGKKDIVYAHNYYRHLIETGQVPNQPTGKNFQTMVFDQKISIEARKVSQQCEMSHVIGTDSRWSYVGQNLYISYSSKYDEYQDWATAARQWFNENISYRYPFGSTNGKSVGHYTQMVWAKSYAIGCDFILFKDSSKPKYPYAKLYTCNYGPGGNYNGQAPYERGEVVFYRRM